MRPGTRSGTAEDHVGGPASGISDEGDYSDVVTLTTPSPSLVPEQSGGECSSCGSDLRPNAKFCTSCGTRT